MGTHGQSQVLVHGPHVTMEPSLFYLIVFLSLFSVTFVFYLFLSTCLGEPLKRWLSSQWDALLIYADKQPAQRNRRARTRFGGATAPASAFLGGGRAGAHSYTRLHDEGYEMTTLQKQEQWLRESRR